MLALLGACASPSLPPLRPVCTVEDGGGIARGHTADPAPVPREVPCPPED